MNKLLLYILLLTTTASFSAVAGTARTEVVFLPVADTVAHQELSLEPGFKRKYSGKEFEYERKTGSKSAWDRFKEWLGKMWEKIFGTGGTKKEGINWVDVTLNILAVVIIAFVAYMIVRAILNKEGMWIFGRGNKKIKSYDLTEEDLNTMDFPNLVRTTRESGNYRLAVRYYYLWLLRSLSDRELIKWHADKTNRDYLYELKSESLRKEFEFLSYIYDYSWYGEFELDHEAYEKAERAFLKTINTL